MYIIYMQDIHIYNIYHLDEQQLFGETAKLI